MLCPHCQKDVAISREYCPYCGKRMQMEFNDIASSVHDDAAVRRGEKIEQFLSYALFVLVLAGTIMYSINELYDRQLVTDFSEGPMIPAPAAQFPTTTSTTGLKPVQDVQKVRGLAPEPPTAFGYRFAPIKTELIKANGGMVPKDLLQIQNGLRYLVTKQTGKGNWEIDTRDLRIPAAQSQAAQNMWAEVGVASICLLPLLAEGEIWTAPNSKYGFQVKRGIAYLAQQQDPATGRFGPAQAQTFFMWNHAFALIAMSEAAGLSADPWLRDSAQRGVEMLERIQGPKGGWGYTDSIGADRIEQTLSTVLQVQALAAAREAGIKVKPETFQKALDFLLAVTNADGSVQYDANDVNTRDEHNILSGMVLMARLQCGEPKTANAQRALVKKIIERDNLPSAERGWGAFWNGNANKPEDLKRAAVFQPYRWYFQSYALFMRGGSDWDPWQKSLFKSMLELQDADGAWRGNHNWSCKYGATFSTAMTLLCMQSMYRLQ